MPASGRSPARDGTAIAAYAARAERPSGAGIVIIPDVRGLHPYYEELTRRFAEAGVDAVAVDLYARTAGAELRADGFEYEPHVLQLDPAAVADDVAAAAAFLRSAEGGTPARIYTVGFCLGGRVSLLTAAAGIGADGVIGLYPWPVGPHRSGLPHPPTRRGASPARCWPSTGRRTPAFPAEARDEFERALTAASVPHRTIVYEGAPHSFFDRKATDFADASTAAWQRDARLHGRHSAR